MPARYSLTIFGFIVILCFLLNCGEHSSTCNMQIETASLYDTTEQQLLVREIKSMRDNGSDSLNLIFLCGEETMPNHSSILDMYSKTFFSTFNPDSSFYRLLPKLFFASTFYGNTGKTLKFKWRYMNNWISDVAITNLLNMRRYVKRCIVDSLYSGYYKAVKEGIPGYQYQEVYESGPKPLILIDAPSKIDSLRIAVMCNDSIATDFFESILREAGNIGEMAYYYYFQGYLYDKPELFFKAAQCLYESSENHDVALAGAFNMLRMGKKRGSVECELALNHFENFVDSLVLMHSF